MQTHLFHLGSSAVRLLAGNWLNPKHHHSFSAPVESIVFQFSVIINGIDSFPLKE
jgi:hypothetical protein